MIEKNVFGDLEYSIGEFFVPHKTGNTGKYAILRRHPWYVTDAVVWHNEYTCWNRTPTFDSFIQAVKYLKDNIDCLA